MRNFLLLIISFLSITAVSAQTAVVVNSPSSIAGAKLFGVGQFGADLASGTWTADAAFIVDETPPINDGCETVVNTSDLAGKIVLIERGSCEFGFKALAAENAGAVGAIVVNNVAGGAVQDMGPGAVGAQVTIPVVLISLEDGAAIKAELANGPVNITMGAIIFNNNVSIDVAKVMNPPFGTVPEFAVGNGQFVVSPGGIILNKGVNDAENPILQATIEFNGNQVYSEADAAELIVSGDTSEFISLPSYEPTEGIGQYTLSYEVSYDSTDESDFDNSISTTFYVSQNVFSKAQWDVTNNRPARTNAYTVSGGGNILFLSGFRMENAAGATLDSVKFYIATADTTFGHWADESEVRVYAFLWDDLNGDSLLTSDEFTNVAFNIVELDENLDEQWVTVELLETEDFEGSYTVVDDEVNIFIGTRFEGSELVYFGFDENIDLTQYNDQALFTTEMGFPYVQTSSWDADTGVPSDFGLFNNGMGGTFLGGLSTALYVTPMANNTQEPLLEDIAVNIYPNPATDRFTTEVELPSVSKFIEYTVRDVAGRQLFTARKDNVQMDKAVFNVSALPAGQYYLMVRTENGVATYPVSVQR